MPNLTTDRFTPMSVLSLVLGGWLVLMPQSSLATGFSLTQNRKIDNLSNHQQPVKISQFNQNFESYFVYVDSNNPQLLQRVRQVEPSAYIRQYNGRNVIQSGVFTRQSNAQQRVRELELNGIFDARVVSFSNAEQIPYHRDVNRTTRANNQQELTKFYFVVIPSTVRSLRSLGDRIQRKIGKNGSVFLRTQPRGAHIAVGPFIDRAEAHQWNSYLQSLGYGDARVYYGK
ncbi:hypothetical protein VB711_01535 [Cronbergia sp. UHCC 0137]|uniref:hypothetical protein n=1 Tax=Cronbergia sp. UHCC 0137 TaxID=3110239 RepID=UPI002B21EFD3|nr:hypothetical protein [Cronbergia sp. UHCC 0137]MEA5616525.1 hypothetical protein [Cronbergia sp. UHCC 0137]